MTEGSPAWQRDCLRWRGKVLTGRYAHWCQDWDGLPVDETTPEWPCVCAKAGFLGPIEEKRRDA